MANQIYQTATEKLEQVLPAKVVERILSTGIRQMGRTPDNVTFHDMEHILNNYVHKRLSVVLSEAEATKSVNMMLNALKVYSSSVTDHDPMTEQESLLDAAKRDFKKLEHHFDHPEVQRLHNELKLLEQHHQNQEDIREMLFSFDEQSQRLAQKLEQELIAQGDVLVRLEVAYEYLQEQALDSHALRQLDRLLERIRQAHRSRKLVTVTQGRAWALVRDLRAQARALPGNLLEPEPAENPNSDEVNELIPQGLLGPNNTADHAVLLAQEQHELNQLEASFSRLLAHDSDLQLKLKNARTKIKNQQPLGANLLALRTQLERSRERTRNALTQELNDMQDNLAKEQFHDMELRPELQRSVRLTLELLSSDLPDYAHIQALRDRYQMLLKQSATRTVVRERQKDDIKVKLEQQANLIEQLVQALRRNQELVSAYPEAYRPLQQALAELQKAQQHSQLASVLPHEVHGLLERLKAQAKENIKDERHRQGLQLSTLISEVHTMPLNADVRSQASSLVRDMNALQGRLENSSNPLPSQAMEQITQRLTALKQVLRRSLSHKLDDLIAYAKPFEEEAAILLDKAKADLAQGRYPDLMVLEQKLQQQRETVLSEQLAELHRLEAAWRRLGETDELNTKRLNKLLKQARTHLENGEPTHTLEAAREALEHILGQHQEGVARYEERLDEALKRYRSIADLNTPQTNQLAEVLNRLSEHKDSLERLTSGARQKLEQRLTQAEAYLEVLTEQRQQTRRIAQKLRGSNQLQTSLGLNTGRVPQLAPNLNVTPTANLAPQPETDPLFNASEEAILSDFLDNGSEVSDGPAETPVAFTLPETPEVPQANATDGITRVLGDHTMLNTWLDDYLQDQGVVEAMLFDAQGTLIVGQTARNQHEVFQAIAPLHDDAQALADPLAQNRIRLCALETQQELLMVAWLKTKHSAAIVLNDPDAFVPIMNKLRRDLPAMSRLLSAV